METNRMDDFCSSCEAMLVLTDDAFGCSNTTCSAPTKKLLDGQIIYVEDKATESRSFKKQNHHLYNRTHDNCCQCGRFRLVTIVRQLDFTTIRLCTHCLT